MFDILSDRTSGFDIEIENHHDIRDIIIKFTLLTLQYQISIENIEMSIRQYQKRNQTIFLPAGSDRSVFHVICWN